MDQRKIGTFIAELRKEQDMTQRQLAERIGVSDKTISKWECGNGLPELSSIPLLCESLHINMNELLSGERLKEENYSRKAEENMMTLMKETAEQKKKNRNGWKILLASLAGVTAAFLLSNVFVIASGSFSFWSYFDMATLLMLVLPTILILVAAGQGKAFLKAFPMLGNIENYTREQLFQSKRALKLAAQSMLVLGVLSFIIALIQIGVSSLGTGMTLETLLANITIASYGILYGLAAYLLLLPLQSRLEQQCKAEE